MTDTVDLMIRARFDAVANSSDDRDWNDVLARAVNAEPNADRSAPRTTFLRRVPTRVALVAAVVLLAVVVTSVAFGWPQTFIDFFTSAPAPTKIKNWFGYDNVTAPPGMNPQAIPGEARKIISARFLDEKPSHVDHLILHTLYIAPRKGGGFCYLWTDADGGCAPAETAPTTPALRAAGPLGVTWFGNHYPQVVDGFVRTGATQTVEARFADGATAAIPVTWVSAPINTGFFVYTVPSAHRNRADAVRSVVALDANGNIIGRESFPLTQWSPAFVPQTLPDGKRVLLPRDADVAKAREMFSFRATDGAHIYLWVVPLAGGGDCYVDNQGEGCGPSNPVLRGGLYGGGNRVLFFGQTKPDVATVELRYQNGESERLTPIDGFVVHDITPAHYKRGTRLVAAVALNRGGNAILTQQFQPQDPVIYPCKKPINQGHGMKTCP